MTKGCHNEPTTTTQHVEHANNPAARSNVFGVPEALSQSMLRVDNVAADPSIGAGSSPIIGQAADGRPSAAADVGHAAAFGYQPALDGVRGIAVALVLLFHAGFGWMSGGYVGVSVFFTLSGYLITSLALVEHGRSGRFSATAFYARRVRRLLPASLLCLTGVMVAAWLDQFTGVTRLRHDLWAALLQIYNWTVLAGDDGYAEQMSRAAGQRAPLDHYWSLAIEEQFYWLWPLVLLLVLRLTPRARLAAVAALAGASVVATIGVSAIWGSDATYFATPARLPEILVGAVAAVVLHHHRAVVDLLGAGRGLVLALSGLAVVVGAAVAWPAEGGPAHHGWFPAFALASGALIVGLQIASPLRRVVSVVPLVLLGRVSYGVYLYHWPVYTLVDERRLDIGRAPLFAVRAAITLAIAAASYVLVERPIRTRGFGLRPTLGVAAVACTIAASVVAFVPDRDGTYTFVAPETRSRAAIPRLADGEALVPLSADDPGSGIPDGLSRPVRVMIVGDSTAYATGEGMVQWSAEHRDVMRVTPSAAVGCGLNPTGMLPDDGYREVCDDIRRGIVEHVANLRVDAVVAMVTFRDMEDRMWNPAEGVLTPTDDAFRQHLLDGYEVLTSQLLAAGATRVIWVVPPTPSLPPVGDLAPMLEDDRIAAYRRVLRALPLSFPGQVVTIDLAAWLAAQPDPPERYDGLHWTLDGAVRVTEEFLVPEIFATLLPEQDGTAP
jgi:peptidoglycan/LPS O-acetylase OafA/YrhL